MKQITEEQILSVLRALKPDGESRDIVTLDWVKGLALRQTPDGTQASFALEVPPELGVKLEPLRAMA